METIIILVLIVLMYIVPEVIRAQRKKDYQYPDIPEKIPSQVKKPAELELPPTFFLPTEMQPESEYDLPISAATSIQAFETEKPTLTSRSPWLQGVIMSEILNPPLARRGRHYK